MKFVFNGIVHMTNEGDEAILELIDRNDVNRLESLGIDSAGVQGDCRIGMSSDDPGSFYCVDNGCGSIGGECRLRNSGSTYWCSCVGVA